MPGDGSIPYRQGLDFPLLTNRARMNMKRFSSKWRTLIKQTVAAWIDDYAPSMGAALSYYTVFSLAPMLLIVISVAGLAFGEEAARGEIFGQLRGLMGVDAAKTIEDLLTSVSEPKEGVAATGIGIALLLIGATSVFGELRRACAFGVLLRATVGDDSRVHAACFRSA